jgi:hypothetical protein
MAKSTRNCFVSYHHENDQKYITKLREVISNMKVADYSLKDDIGHLTENAKLLCYSYFNWRKNWAS